MKTKHTKGTWFHTRGQIFSTVKSEIRDSNKICNIVNGYVGFDGETEANAKLIAAAPELLSSLETLERMISNSVRLLHKDYADQFFKPLEEARKAIKKATE